MHASGEPATTIAAALGVSRATVSGWDDTHQRAAGVDPSRVYQDKLSGTSTREQRPGLSALLDYARPGHAIVVLGIDRLGRNAAEVMMTIRELGTSCSVLFERASTPPTLPVAWWPALLASLAELELELGRERRSAAREARRARGQSLGRPKALDPSS